MRFLLHCKKLSFKTGTGTLFPDNSHFQNAVNGVPTLHHADGDLWLQRVAAYNWRD